MDDINSFNSTPSNKGWLHGSTILNLAVDLEYNTTLIGVGLYGLSNTPVFQNLIVTGGTATSLLLAPSTGTSSSAFTHPEGVVFNNLYVYSGYRPLQGGCSGSTLSAPAVEFTGTAETQWRSGKSVMCSFSSTNNPQLQLDGTCFGGCGGSGTAVQITDGVLIDGVSLGGSLIALRIEGTDCNNGASCGFANSANYGQNNIQIVHSIFEPISSSTTAYIAINDVSSLFTRILGSNITIKDNTYRCGGSPCNLPTSIVNASYLQGSLIESSFSASTLGSSGQGTVNLDANSIFNRVQLFYDSIVSSRINANVPVSTQIVLVQNSNQTFSTLPTSMANGSTFPLQGTQQYCRDCTTASTCASGGTGHMAVSNGTNWTCQ